MPGEALPSISAPALAAVYAAARSAYPNECCGFLLGPRDEPVCDEARPCVNVQDDLHAEDPARHPRTARHAYHIGATDLFFLDRSLRSERPVKIVYHSHVDVGAYFSDEDQRAATFDGEPAYPVAYLVVDVRADEIQEAKLYQWDAGRHAFVERAVLPPPAPPIGSRHGRTSVP